MVQLFRARGQQKQPQSEQPLATRVLPETSWAIEEMPSGIPPEDSVVVTISRQFGSGGSEVGRITAQKSGLSYIDREIIDEVARRLGVEAEQVRARNHFVKLAVGNERPIVRGNFSRHPHRPFVCVPLFDRRDSGASRRADGSGFRAGRI